jgi:hypothetical protein
VGWWGKGGSLSIAISRRHAARKARKARNRRELELEHDGKSPRSRWRLPRFLGAAALAAGLLAVTLPAGAALASPAVAKAAASPAATAAPQYSLDFFTSVKALGHAWELNFSVDDNTVDLLLGTAYGSTTEDYDWTTASAYAPTAARQFKVTSTGHATFGTGSALRPVLAAAIAFTPVKATKSACSKGSDVTYAGRISGALTLVTGLRGVKFSIKFTGKTAAALDADKSCVPVAKPTKTACTGGEWFIGGVSLANGALTGAQTLGSKPKWQDGFSQSGAKTAAKWVTRSLLMSASAPAPTVSTAKQTVSVAGSGAITGAATITYSNTFPAPAVTCYFDGKPYKSTTTTYFGVAIKVARAFQAHALLAGTVTAEPGTEALYSAVKLSAA